MQAVVIIYTRQACEIYWHVHKAFFKTPILRYSAGLVVEILVHVFIMCGSRVGGGGTGGQDSPWKITSLYLFEQYWSGSPGKLQSYQASIHCRAIIGPLAKRYLNGISLVGWWWPIFSVIWILGPPLINYKNKLVRVGPPLTKLSGSEHVHVHQ